MGAKGELKAKKVAVEEEMVREMEGLARDVAGLVERVREGEEVLSWLPGVIEGLEARVEEIKGRIGEVEEECGNGNGAGGRGSQDPRMNMSLVATREAVLEQQRRNRELDGKIVALQRQLPRKIEECEKVEGELEDLEAKRDECTRLARQMRRAREEGGRDVLEEQGRWYRSSEVVLIGLLDVKG